MDISLSLLLPSFLFLPFLSSSPFPPSLLYFSPALGMYICMYICISSVQSLSRVQLFATSWTAARQASLFITNSWSLLKLSPLSWWCHPTISSSVVPFYSRLQCFPASVSFPMSRFFASGGQSIGVSASASVLPMNIQDWFPLEGTGLISLQGLSRVFSNTTAVCMDAKAVSPSPDSNHFVPLAL